MPHRLHDHLRRNIRTLIHDAGYRSCELFAHENGIEKSTVSRILRGEREPKVGTLDRIRQALEVDWNAMMSDQPRSSAGRNSSAPNR